MATYYIRNKITGTIEEITEQMQEDSDAFFSDPGELEELEKYMAEDHEELFEFVYPEEIEEEELR